MEPESGNHPDSPPPGSISWLNPTIDNDPRNFYNHLNLNRVKL